MTDIPRLLAEQVALDLLIEDAEERLRAVEAGSDWELLDLVLTRRNAYQLAKTVVSAADPIALAVKMLRPSAREGAGHD